MSPRARLIAQIVYALLVLALPWAYLAWATRPGAERPLIADVVATFLLASAPLLQNSIDRAIETRHPAIAFVGIGLALANGALLALRLRDLSTLLILSAATLALALVGYGANVLARRLFARSPRGSV